MCVFCEIGSDRIIAENEYAIAFRDGYPVTKFHTLVTPKRHISDYFELTEEEMKAINTLVKEQKILLDYWENGDRY